MKKPRDNKIKTPFEKNVPEILCACLDFTKSDMARIIGQNSELGFEEILTKTGAGGKCTACLLDLEWAFSVLYSEHPSKAENGGGGEVKSAGSKEPFRRKFYKLIDSISPVVPLRLQSPMPVLFGRDIESFALMANHSLMFEKMICAPPFEFSLIVRDEEGKVIDRITSNVAREAFSRVNVSNVLLERKPNTELGIGSVEILQQASFPGIRGTRRPQIEIVTKSAAAALHGQAPYKAAASSSFVCPNQPADNHSYITIVSVSDAPLTLEVTFPIDLIPSDLIRPLKKVIVVPPHGARIVALMLEPAQSEAFGEPIMTVNWKASGRQKVHLVTASASHDRIALDHL